MWDINMYVNTYTQTWLKTMKKFSIMSNLQTNYRFKLDLQKVDQYTGNG